MTAKEPSLRTVVLMTDFGQEDWYVGTMKGVIHRVNNQIPIIDLSHEVPAQDVHSGAFVLWNAYQFFPSGSVFINVVDPGVGSKRKILAIETEHYYFLAPDNGLMDLVLNEEPSAKAVEVNNPEYMLNRVSNTFHGRDVFAPAGAQLASGTPIEKLGEPIEVPPSTKSLQKISTPGQYEGEVIYTDTYGNLISNLQLKAPLVGVVSISGQRLPLRNTYLAVQPGEPLALKGSNNLIEISVRNGSAKEYFSSLIGTQVSVDLRFP